MKQCNCCEKEISEDKIESRSELYQFLLDGTELCTECEKEYFKKLFKLLREDFIRKID